MDNKTYNGAIGKQLGTGVNLILLEITDNPVFIELFYMQDNYMGALTYEA